MAGGLLHDRVELRLHDIRLINPGTDTAGVRDEDAAIGVAAANEVAQPGVIDRPALLGVAPEGTAQGVVRYDRLDRELDLRG